MYREKQRGGFGRLLAGFAFFFIILGMLGAESEQEETSFVSALMQELAAEFMDALYVQFLPGGAKYAGESNAHWLVRTQTGSMMPLYGMNRGGEPETVQKDISPQEDVTNQKEKVLQAQTSVQEDEEILTLMEAENQAAKEPVPFVPRSQRVQVNIEELADYETLIEQFYTIDANTFAGMEQLNMQSLMKDVSIRKGDNGPQILIYHTHSQEAFADSVGFDVSTSIVGVGEHLAEILQEKYGYQVLHHTGQYDVENRDNAYGNSLPALKQLLEDNPTIEVVIDLHRDQMPEETKLVMDLDGRPTARFMFFNGLSRTRQSGDIDYLKNDNIQTNLAMSFQMQLKCQEYYPGLTRKIYLKGYRYNMHLCPRTLLVELGAQNNTVEEAMNACEPLAHVLDMVLSGK